MSQQRLTESPEKTPQRIERRAACPAAARSFQGGLHPLLQLQRTIGNRAVGRLMQARLAVRHPGDPYAQAADGVAEHVTSLPAPASTAPAQRQLMPDEAKDTPPLQTNRALSAQACTAGQDMAPVRSESAVNFLHELTHVVQQSGRSPRVPQAAAVHSHAGVAVATPSVYRANGVNTGLIQRQPKSEGPTFRDLPIFLGKLELDVGKNLQDYGHHLYQAAILHPDEPGVLQNALTRYALGLNVLKTSYRFAGFEQSTADKLALGTGILFKSLTFVREGEFVFDFQVDIGRGVKFETNLELGVNPKDVTEVRKAGVNIGLVGQF